MTVDLPQVETYPFAGPPHRWLQPGHGPRPMGLEPTGDGRVLVRWSPDNRDKRPVGGVYRIRHIATGRVYVGSAEYIKTRWAEHLSQLRHGRHACELLQADWDAQGPEAFVFEVVARVARQRGRYVSDLRLAEYRTLRASPLIYNRPKFGGKRDDG